MTYPRELREYEDLIPLDFEYRALPGEHVDVCCMVSYGLRSGRRWRLWRDQLTFPPFPIDRNHLFVAYNFAAELSCFLALGWPLPPITSILDLRTAFLNHTNGHVLPDGVGLLGAMSYFGLNSISVVEKQEMRDLAMRGGPFTEQERKDLLDYCETDVVALVKLLGKMYGQV